MTPKAKVLILENLIDELGIRGKDKVTINMQLKMYKEAYDALNTEEKREQYMGRSLTEIAYLQNIRRLISKFGGDPKQELEILEMENNDTIKNVKKKLDQVPEYDVLYDDEDITLCTKNVISYENSYFLNDITEYVLFVKDEESNIISGCDFFGNVIIPEMSNPEYKVIFFLSIKQFVEQQMKGIGKYAYMGKISKDKNGYYVVKNKSEERAISKYMEQKAKKRKHPEMGIEI